MIRLWTIYELEPLTLAQLNELDAQLRELLAAIHTNATERDVILASLANIRRVRQRHSLPKSLQR
ncbi:MAG: hypothetical protein AAGG56_12950 [Pseudomonadota bacterium]